MNFCFELVDGIRDFPIGTSCVSVSYSVCIVDFVHGLNLGKR